MLGSVAVNFRLTRIWTRVSLTPAGLCCYLVTFFHFFILVCPTLLSSTVETRRIITRSKTGSLTPKHFCDSVTKSIIKTSKTNSDDTVVVINKDGDMTRVTRSRSSASVVNHQVAHYRLGKVTTPHEKVQCVVVRQCALNMWIIDFYYNMCIYRTVFPSQKVL